MPRSRNLRWGSNKTGNWVAGSTSRMCPEKLQLYFTSCSLDTAGPGMGWERVSQCAKICICQSILPFWTAKAAQLTTQRAVWESLSQNDINLDGFGAVEAEMLKMTTRLERFHKEKLSHRLNLLKSVHEKRLLMQITKNHTDSSVRSCFITHWN